MSLYSGQVQSTIDEVKAALQVGTATGGDLAIIGATHAVPLAPDLRDSDDIYRRVIQVLAWLPRNRMLTPYLLAEILFGSQQTLRDAGIPAWEIYVVNANELVFECPLELLAATNANASYLHGFSGLAVQTAGDVIDVAGTDARLAVNTGSLVGFVLYVYHTSVWNSYSVLGHSYVAGVNTFTLDAATVPAGSWPMFVDISSGDSFSGDYMAADAVEAAGGTLPPTLPVASRTYLHGQGLLDVFVFYMFLVLAAGVVLRTEVL